MITLTPGGQIATTIIDQMGGFGRLKMMAGAHNFTVTEEGVTFTFKGSTKANTVYIDLTEEDLYDVKFYKVPKLTAKTNMINYLAKMNTPTAEETGLYWDMLIDTFERVTGLYLRIPALKCSDKIIT